MAIRNFLNSSETFLESVSKPLIFYNVFVIALICYNATQQDFMSMGKNFVFLLVGSVLIWMLTYLGFEPAAWALLFLPVFFFVALLALLVITQIVNTDVTFCDNANIKITGNKIKDWFGLNDTVTEDAKLGITHDLSSGFFPPVHPVDEKCKKPMFPTLPPLPPIKEPDITVTCQTCE